MHNKASHFAGALNSCEMGGFSIGKVLGDKLHILTDNRFSFRSRKAPAAAEILGKGRYKLKTV